MRGVGGRGGGEGIERKREWEKGGGEFMDNQQVIEGWKRVRARNVSDSIRDDIHNGGGRGKCVGTDAGSGSGSRPDSGGW